MNSLFKIKKKFQKMAGTVIPNDPKSWPTEIMKNISQNHPYIDMSSIKLDFVDVDPETKGASGKIIAGDKLAIPFSIRKNDENRKLELDPIDIVYNGDQFKALSEASYAEGLQGEAMGRVQNSEDKVPSKNQYIGHLTGDATPLEWSTSNSATGGRMVTAGIGILSSMVKNQNDVARLRQMIQNYHGINSALESLGLKNDLVNLGSAMNEGPSKARMAHVVRNATGFSVAFNDGDMRQVTASDLKVFLGDDYYPIMRQVANRGWAIIKDFPDIKSADMEELSVTAGPIEIGGPYLVDTAMGKLLGIVASEQLNFDGSVSSAQTFLGKGGEYSCTKEKLMGYRMPDDDCTCAISAGIISPGTKGVFFDNAFGSARCTPCFKVNQVVSMPGMPDVIIATDEHTSKKIGLMPSEGVMRFRKISNPPSFMPENSYYVPGHMEFFAIKQKINARDRGQEVKKIQGKISIKKNAGLYNIFGNLESGEPIDFRNTSKTRAITKLAWYGLSESAIEKVASMKDGEEKELRGLVAPIIKEDVVKIASKNNSAYKMYFDRIKIAADEVAAAVNESPTAQQDPQVLDAALSLQFVNNENMEEVIDSAPHFEEVEDKLSRMLLAARHGEASIDEKGVARALQGMGSAIQSIKTLTIALKQRGDIANNEA